MQPSSTISGVAPVCIKPHLTMSTAKWTPATQKDADVEVEGVEPARRVSVYELTKFWEKSKLKCVLVPRL